MLTRLWELAGAQHGYVTTADAQNHGITGPALVKAAARGRLHRVAYGVYRFPEFPGDELDPYVLAALWPARRGVLSHETALQLLDLCDVEPEKIHINVPTGYRVRRRGGEAYVVHQEDLDPKEVVWFEGVRIVSPGEGDPSGHRNRRGAPSHRAGDRHRPQTGQGHQGRGSGTEPAATARR